MTAENSIVPPKDEEELALEKLVFGDVAGFEANLRKIENLYEYSDEDDGMHSDFENGSSVTGSDVENEDEDLFFIDDGGDASVAHVPSTTDDMDIDNETEEEEAAWIDSDDDKNTVSILSNKLKQYRQAPEEQTVSGAAYVTRLRSQFEKIYPRPEWVVTFGEEKKGNEKEVEDYTEEAEEDSSVGINTTELTSILNSTNNYIKTTTKLLPPTKLDIMRLKDANIVRRSRGAVHGLCFHPLHPLLISGGTDRTLRVYHIDGRINKFVSLVHFRDLPIRTVQFAPGSNLVYAAGHRKYMNRWNIFSGEIDKILRMYGQEKFQKSYEYFKISPNGTYVALLGSSGWVNLVNGQTGQFVRGYRVDGDAVDFEFTKDEKMLMVANRAGDMWEFQVDSSSTKILRRWADLDAVAVTAIRFGGPGDRWLAVGTESGVVHLYDRSTFATVAAGANPKPFREVGNLVTPISHLAFSPDGQILCISSKHKKDALKMVHLPLGTVFANWPTSGTPLGRVTVTEFSPNGQMVAIGNDVGKITLWRLNHY
ncbi:CIC11C00000004952 [Sungouiella intermedia]|uniref:CIC11C00000004952 n=1 Tax=Sungouiella intermedia TaxID=45354 RepID=A0A1L0BVU7_9ASCO|nr:CIC11C00000004952 [[Candida] intermedia]